MILHLYGIHLDQSLSNLYTDRDSLLNDKHLRLSFVNMKMSGGERGKFIIYLSLLTYLFNFLLNTIL